MGRAVLDVAGSLTLGRKVRVWAHCTRISISTPVSHNANIYAHANTNANANSSAAGDTNANANANAHTSAFDYGYRPGAVTLLALNTDSVASAHIQVSESLSGHGLSAWDAFRLTPADPTAGLSSKEVALNGVVLEMVGAGDNVRLPDLQPKKETGATIVLPPVTFGFFVLPNAKAPACM